MAGHFDTRPALPGTFSREDALPRAGDMVGEIAPANPAAAGQVQEQGATPEAWLLTTPDPRVVSYLGCDGDGPVVVGACAGYWVVKAPLAQVGVLFSELRVYFLAASQKIYPSLAEAKKAAWKIAANRKKAGGHHNDWGVDEI